MEDEDAFRDLGDSDNSVWYLFRISTEIFFEGSVEHAIVFGYLTVLISIYCSQHFLWIARCGFQCMVDTPKIFREAICTILSGMNWIWLTVKCVTVKAMLFFMVGVQNSTQEFIIPL